jgi:hypothetical protein
MESGLRRLALWDDSEVARRWLMLCPIRRDANHRAQEPNEFELNMIRAAMAETIETSEYTSAQQRAFVLRESLGSSKGLQELASSHKDKPTTESTKETPANRSVSKPIANSLASL